MSSADSDSISFILVMFSNLKNAQNSISHLSPALQLESIPAMYLF